MNLQAVYHEQKSNYAYAYSLNEIHIRIRTAKNDCESVSVVVSQKHKWDEKKSCIMEKIATDRLFDYYQYEVHTKDPRLGYYFELYDGKSTWIYSESGFSNEFDNQNAYFHYFQFPYINESDLHIVPEWTKSAVFYEIFVERFKNGDKNNDHANCLQWQTPPTAHSFFGGDLKGIKDQIEYLKNLGINGIYLTPIFASPSNHKYDIVDYRKVDSSFGDISLLKKLVEKAHESGIRIILDGVFNHSSWLFPPFQDVLKNGENSKYKDWFLIESFPLKKFSQEEVEDYSKPINLSNLNYKIFGTSPNMPKLNTDNPELKKYLLESVEMWMRETNIDGWRLDVSDEVSHTFWRDFRKTVKKINPQAILIGENWHNAYSWLQGDQFDGVMNYPVTKSCIEFFALNKIGANEFAADVSKYLMWNSWQADYSMMNLLDSHDTMRFLTWCNGNESRFKMAILFLMSYIGMPCIYYGSEIGMEGRGDPDCRRTFNWNKQDWNNSLWNFYRKLIHLRTSQKALQTGEIQIWSNNNLLYIKRTCNTEKIITVLNNTESSKNVVGMKNSKIICATYDEKGTVSSQVLPSYTGAMYYYEV